MAVTDPSKWGASWGAGVAASGSKWAAGYIAAGPSIFQKGAAAVGNWQAGVAAPTAATAYVAGLQNVNFATVTATVNGPGQGKYTSAGSLKQANYQSFAQIFGPKLQTIVNNLPPRGPRGSAQNRTRLNQLLDQVQATRGQN